MVRDGGNAVPGWGPTVGLHLGFDRNVDRVSGVPSFTTEEDEPWELHS